MDSKRERSRAYPCVDLKTALEFLCRDLDGVGSAPVPKSEVAKALGYSSGTTGPAARKLAALGHFGWLNTKGDNCSLTVAARRMQNASPGSTGYRECLVSALESPPLFNDLLTRFGRVGALPARLGEVLIQDFGVSRVASQEVERIFVSSAVFARVMRDDGRFVPSSDALTISSEDQESLVFDILLNGFKKGHVTIPRSFQAADIPMIQEQLTSLARLLPQHLGLHGSLKKLS